MPTSAAEYSHRVLNAHRPAFDLFTEVAGSLEDVIVKPRRHPSVVDMTLDMLFIQAYKAHSAVAMLAKYGLMEDSATIARRLLEISVQTVFIGAESDAIVQERRAGTYLAFLWRQLPRRIRLRLPVPVRSHWSRIAVKYGRYVRKQAKRWSLNWKEMFDAIGALDVYTADYSFLSGIAHGSPDHQLFVFSRSTVRIHDHAFVSVVLTYATRYYLMAAAQWNSRFHLLPEESLASLVRRATSFKARTQP